MQSRLSNTANKLKLKLQKLYYLYSQSTNEEDKITPLYYAIYNDESFNLIKDILNHNKNLINNADVNGLTPLSLAIMKNMDYSLIKLLINEGADINKTESIKGFSAMHLAIYNLINDYNNKLDNNTIENQKIYKNSLKIVKLLDDKDNDLINKPSKDGIVPAQLIDPRTFPDINHDIFSNYVIINH